MMLLLRCMPEAPYSGVIVGFTKNGTWTHRAERAEVLNVLCMFQFIEKLLFWQGDLGHI